VTPPESSSFTKRKFSWLALQDVHGNMCAERALAGLEVLLVDGSLLLG